jgi:ABC-2 type transport system ATP-binding protein
VRCEGGAASLKGIEGVAKVNDFGRTQDIRMVGGADPQDILSAIMARTKVTSFEVTKPSLHDIFVRIAGPEAREAEHAEDTQNS